MTRIMADSITAADIVPNPDLVAGYVNGNYAWTTADWQMFGQAGQVRINVTGGLNLGNCLDIETGDATPGHAAAWFDARHAAGTTNLAIYCSRDTLPAVRAAMGARHYYVWLATLDGTRGPFPGIAAVQWAGQAQTHGHYDLSEVYDDTWHPAPGPAPTPVPAGARSLAAKIASDAQTLSHYAQQLHGLLA